MALKDSYAGSNDSFVRIYGTTWIAQTFTASSSYSISSVKLRISKNGDPGNVTVAITHIDGSTPPKPDITDIRCTVTISNSGIPTSDTGVYTEFAFSSPASLVSGTVYAIVISAPAGSAVNHEIRWRTDVTSPSYSGGNQATSSNSGSSWTTVTATDQLFETYDSGGTQREFTGTTALVISSIVSFNVISGAVLVELSGTSSLSLIVVAELNISVVSAWPNPRTVNVPELDWSDTTNTWTTNLAIQGSGGGRYLITAIAFSLDENTDGIIFFGS